MLLWPADKSCLGNNATFSNVTEKIIFKFACISHRITLLLNAIQNLVSLFISHTASYRS